MRSSTCPMGGAHIRCEQPPDARGAAADLVVESVRVGSARPRRRREVGRGGSVRGELSRAAQTGRGGVVRAARGQPVRGARGMSRAVETGNGQPADEQPANGAADAPPSHPGADESYEGWVGRTLDERYRIDGLLGEGGMGAVFVAEHLKLSKKVALKVIHPEFVGDGEVAARFAREAMASVEAGASARRERDRLRDAPGGRRLPRDAVRRGRLAPGDDRRARRARLGPRGGGRRADRRRAQRRPQARDRSPRPQARQRHARPRATTGATW